MEGKISSPLYCAECSSAETDDFQLAPQKPWSCVNDKHATGFDICEFAKIVECSRCPDQTSQGMSLKSKKSSTTAGFEPVGNQDTLQVKVKREIYLRGRTHEVSSLTP
jgi:hypothetical protein